MPHKKGSKTIPNCPLKSMYYKKFGESEVGPAYYWVSIVNRQIINSDYTHQFI